LEHAVSSMPAFDVDAGWAELAAQLEGPIAPVIPLRRYRSRRMTALAVAAAVFIGGSALAMVRHGSSPRQAIASVVTLQGSGLVTGPHVHVAFSGASPVEQASRPGGHGVGGGSNPTAPSSGGGGSAGGGSSNAGSGGSGTPNQDAPDDIDHGSGNDGQHDDNGHGNNAQWHDRPSGGQGSSGGQSSSGGQ